MTARSFLKPVLFIISFFLIFTFTGKKAYSETMEPKALFEKRCSRCHSLDKTNRTESADYWKATVQKMKKKFFSGIKDTDAAIITEYLIQTKVSSEKAPFPADEQPVEK
jgi:hypothetical protein